MRPAERGARGQQDTPAHVGELPDRRRPERADDRAGLRDPLTTPNTHPRRAAGTAVVRSANHDALYAVSAAPVMKLIP